MLQSNGIAAFLLLLASCGAVAEPVVPGIQGVSLLGSEPSLNGFSVNGAGTSRGPVGTYYVTEQRAPWHTSPYLWAIRGSDYVKNPSAGSEEGPVAIVKTIQGPEIRTSGFHASAGRGAGYRTAPDLVLTQTGQNFITAVDDHFFIDGTSDGAHNYAVSFIGPHAASVYRFDQDWSNGSILFDTGTLYDGIFTVGITYDRWHNSLWVTGFDSSYYFFNVEPDLIAHFYEFSMKGTLLNSFVVPATPAIYTALAMDVDHTLWTVGSASSDRYSYYGILYHYGTDGTYLGSVTLPESIESYGGEIYVDEVPLAPELDALAGTGALSLLGFALALAGERRRRV